MQSIIKMYIITSDIWMNIRLSSITDMDRLVNMKMNVVYLQYLSTMNLWIYKLADYEKVFQQLFAKKKEIEKEEGHL